jgi:hypothetical protein
MAKDKCKLHGKKADKKVESASKKSFLDVQIF